MSPSSCGWTAEASGWFGMFLVNIHLGKKKSSHEKPLKTTEIIQLGECLTIGWWIPKIWIPNMWPDETGLSGLVSILHPQANTCVATFQVPAFVDLSCLFKPGFGHPKSPEVSPWHQQFSHATEAGVQSHLWNCEGLWRKPQEFETLCGGGAARVVLFFLNVSWRKSVTGLYHVTRAHQSALRVTRWGSALRDTRRLGFKKGAAESHAQLTWGLVAWNDTDLVVSYFFFPVNLGIIEQKTTIFFMGVRVTVGKSSLWWSGPGWSYLS